MRYWYIQKLFVRSLLELVVYPLTWYFLSEIFFPNFQWKIWSKTFIYRRWSVILSYKGILYFLKFRFPWAVNSWELHSVNDQGPSTGQNCTLKAHWQYLNISHCNQTTNVKSSGIHHGTYSFSRAANIVTIDFNLISVYMSCFRFPMPEILFPSKAEN